MICKKKRPYPAKQKTLLAGYRSLYTLLTVLIVWTGTLPALAYESGDVVGNNEIAAYQMILPDDYLCAETAIGDLAADAVRAATGANIAIVSSGYITATLQNGPVTYGDILNVFSDTEIMTAYVTPAELTEYLEGAVSHAQLGQDEKLDVAASAYDGFPQVSGIVFQYEVPGLIGARINWIQVAGETLDLEDSRSKLLLAAPVGSLDGSLGLPVIVSDRTGITLAEAVANYISENKTADTQIGRIEARGVISSIFSTDIPVGFIAGSLVFLCLLFSFCSKHSIFFRSMREEYGPPQKG